MVINEGLGIIVFVKSLVLFGLYVLFNLESLFEFGYVGVCLVNF